MSKWNLIHTVEHAPGDIQYFFIHSELNTYESIWLKLCHMINATADSAFNIRNIKLVPPNMEDVAVIETSDWTPFLKERDLLQGMFDIAIASKVIAVRGYIISDDGFLCEFEVIFTTNGENFLKCPDNPVIALSAPYIDIDTFRELIDKL